MTTETYITQAQALSLIQANRQPASRGLLGDVAAMTRDIIGQSAIDGSITLGDVAKAFGVMGFFSIVTPLGGTGAGLSFDVFFPGVLQVMDFAQLGMGLGLLGGALLAGERLARDYRFDSTVAPIAEKADEPEPLGLRIFTKSEGYTRYVVLLPTVKRAIIKDMAQQTAHMFFAGGNKNFSKAHLGKAWGKHLNDAKKTLLQIGYLSSVKNNTCVFTSHARQWLGDYY